MPSGQRRPRATDLFLCAHHYRLSRPALAAAGAHVGAVPGTPPEIAAWTGVGPDTEAVAESG
jgi:hypothetical protein